MDVYEVKKNSQVSIDEIQKQQLHCGKYNVTGRWICGKTGVATVFVYKGRQYILPFRAVFTQAMLPCLREVAALQIEAKIDELHFTEIGFESR